jgi:hypothetical protein
MKASPLVFSLASAAFLAMPSASAHGETGFIFGNSTLDSWNPFSVRAVQDETNAPYELVGEDLRNFKDACKSSFDRQRQAAAQAWDHVRAVHPDQYQVLSKVLAVTSGLPFGFQAQCSVGTPKDSLAIHPIDPYPLAQAMAGKRIHLMVHTTIIASRHSPKILGPLMALIKPIKYKVYIVPEETITDFLFQASFFQSAVQENLKRRLEETEESQGDQEWFDYLADRALTYYLSPKVKMTPDARAKAVWDLTWRYQSGNPKYADRGQAMFDQLVLTWLAAAIRKHGTVLPIDLNELSSRLNQSQSMISESTTQAESTL